MITYATSHAKGQKEVALQRFNPPLPRKPNPNFVPTSKEIFQIPESTTSTLELDNDDINDDGDEDSVNMDSSFDVSFDADVDDPKAATRQYV